MNFSKKNHKHPLNNISGVSKFLKSLLIILTFCFTSNVEAQFLKKLGEKAEKAAERTLEKKVEQKAEKETDKAFDSTFNNSSKRKKKKKSSKSNIPFRPMGSGKTPESKYRFSHTYIIEMNSGKRTNDIIYYLNSHGDYIGFTMPDTKGTNMMSVMDMQKQAIFMFMDNSGSKQLMAMNMDMDLDDMANDAIEDTNYSIKPTGKTKTILGYKAKEYESKGKDMHGTIWITNDVDVSFFKAFSSQKTKKGMDKSWMKNMTGVMLEMTMTDTSKRKPTTVTMKCKALKKEKLTIDTSQYKKMM